MSRNGGLYGLIGLSPAIRQVYKIIELVAPTKATVLLIGERGTGKDRIAKVIHEYSPRKEDIYFPINCARNTESTLANEMFGHQSGSYTGASSDTKGWFGAATNGTIFLDEINRASSEFQDALLRVLEDGSYTQIGGERILYTSARVIAATNGNLDYDVSIKRFNAALKDRLEVVPIPVPSLEERIEDVPLLAEYFVKKYSVDYGKHVTLTPGGVDYLMYASWPGNVRQLKHFIESAIILNIGESRTNGSGLELNEKNLEGCMQYLTHVKNPDFRNTIELTDYGNKPIPTLKAARDGFEKAYLLRILTIAEYKVTRAAAIAGKYRSDFYDLLRKHNIKPTERWKYGEILTSKEQVIPIKQVQSITR
ncbi:sigma 54-interacting transcriptional regulator [Candidatus Woesearchaeota archaeon]|nr:sigma 54-interacting transcriptional regulator [Candidatus Woesearchaeota archaeon]